MEFFNIKLADVVVSQITMDEISLQTILDGFNAPLSEEQSWAVCFQCAVYCKQNSNDLMNNTQEPGNGLDSVYFSKDGCISRFCSQKFGKNYKIERFQ